MAGRIRDEDVQRVRDALPIDVVVGDYVQLTNGGGGQLKGVCPFHDEKSASFYVSPSKGVFHCFGCQESGDTITFLQKIEHFSFAEAVERMAAQANITLRYEEGGYNSRGQQGERTRLVEAHKVAAAYYREQLEGAEAEIGRAFLAERGFDAAAAALFGVGYAPAGWEHLVRYLRGKGFTDREILQGGLASQGQRGGLIDRFRGRLVWPIRDVAGEVVGFGARRLREDDNGPKYLNTPETPIYKKSHVLYGIDLAKKEIAKSGRAVVVEGYTDVMACHLAGVTTAVATCGTAFAEDHIKIIRRLLMDTSAYRGETVFTFDGDAAGQKAALRAFEDDQKFAARTSIAISPGGMDPCELRLAQGEEAVRELIAHPVPLFEFALRTTVARHRVDAAEGRAAALEEAAPIVAKIKDPSIRHEYAVQLAGLLGILDEQFVVRRVSQISRWQREAPQQGRGQQRGQAARQQPAPQPAAAPRLNPHDRASSAERELLKLALQRAEVVNPYFDQFGEDEFTTPQYAAVRRAVGKAGGTVYGQGVPGFLGLVNEAAENDQVRMVIAELTVEPLRHKLVDEHYAGQILVAVRLQAVDRRLAEVHSHLQRIASRSTAEELTPVQQELYALQQYKESLKTRGAAGL
ncbi:DNA primase [Kitasatospora acidiphila]|uniref:DNA primase n=1 Tax=Kitasatospora acidiphila TaxID=2567942 RepID=A0A540WAS4_9ACTN|nr:DNA primase [Kitasatospora acidiphila]TQF05514.1 DNA primase [Kitasatospora acidiphila]